MGSKAMIVGRIFGIEVRASRSWIFVFLFVTLSMSVQFEKAFGAWGLWASIGAGIVASMLFFGSVLAHELAHCVAARQFGIEVRSVTLNFFGGMSTFGREPARPVEELVYSLAGPFANVVVAGLLVFVYLVAKFAETPFSLAAAELVATLAVINVALAVFNLAPGLPLDGGRVLRAVAWWITGSYERATRLAAFSGQAIAALLMMVGIALFLLPNPTGLWIALVGFYLFSRARASGFELAVRSALDGLTVSQMWLDTLPQVERSATLGDFARQVGPALDGSSDPHFMVVEDGVIYGLVAVSHAGKVETDRWETARVADVMTPIGQFEKLSFQTDIMRALEAMTRSELGELPVIENNAVQGFVGRESLMRFVSSRIAAQNG